MSKSSMATTRTLVDNSSMIDTTTALNGQAPLPKSTASTPPTAISTITSNLTKQKPKSALVMLPAEANDGKLRGILHYEKQARDAFTLATLIFENAGEEEVTKYGTPEERCSLLGVFAYQMMGVAVVSGTTRPVVFRTLAHNKLGFGKNMTHSYHIALTQKTEQERKKTVGEATNDEKGKVENVDGNTNGQAMKTNGNIGETEKVIASRETKGKKGEGKGKDSQADVQAGAPPEA